MPTFSLDPDRESWKLSAKQDEGFAVATNFPLRNATVPLRRDWHRSMSNNLAAALVVYAGLQIFVISAIVATGATSLLYHLGIAVLIAAIVPAARSMERRWEQLPQYALPRQVIADRFRMDLLRLWGTVLLLPFVWIPIGALTTWIAG